MCNMWLSHVYSERLYSWGELAALVPHTANRCVNAQMLKHAQTNLCMLIASNSIIYEPLLLLIAVITCYLLLLFL